MGNLIDLTGQTFGKLTVISFSHVQKGQGAWWLVRCSCPEKTEKIVRGACLKRGDTKSCGCLNREHMCKLAIKVNKKKIGKFKTKLGESGLKTLYCSYVSKAKRKKRTFQFTIEEFYIITQKNCNYCGVQPYAIAGISGINNLERQKHAGYIYNGIDRIDSNLGYTIENSVPCCKVCNWAKNILSEKEFQDYLDRVTDFRIAQRSFLVKNNTIKEII